MKKKILLIAVLLWTGAVVFGETGYKGIEWWYPMETIKELKKSKTRPLNKAENELLSTEILMIENTPIMGTETDVFYFFSGGILEGISYLIPNKKIEQLKRQLKNYITTLESNGTSEYLFREELKQEYPDINPEEARDVTIAGWGKSLSSLSELFGYEKILEYKPEDTKEKSQVYIYDYNDDTRVYIFENIIEGETVVVYVPHEQDY